MMNRNTMRIGTTVLTAALIAAVAVPAFAAPGVRVGRMRGQVASQTAEMKSKLAANGQGVKGQPREQLLNRIENVLRARKARFDAAQANVNKRIARVTVLADKVEALGGDVTEARATLAAARDHLAKADELEAVAVAKFNAIPDAADKHAAFVEARAAARLAVAELKAARVELRTAAQSLRATIQQLKSQVETGTVDAQ